MEIQNVQKILDLCKENKNKIVNICLRALDVETKKQKIKELACNLSDEQIDQVINYFISNTSLTDDELDKVVGGKYKEYTHTKKDTFWRRLVDFLMNGLGLFSQNRKNKNNIL